MWTPILIAAGGCYVLKLAGLSVPQRVLDGARVQRVAVLLPVALLAALISTQTFGDGLDARAARRGARPAGAVSRRRHRGRRHDRDPSARHMMRFAVGLPNLHDYAEPGRLVALARAAETAGWDGCFIWDHLAYRDPPAPAADPQVVLGAIAVSTSRIRIGALLTPLARRRPSKVARETATLDVLSGGRLVFGAALGWSGEEEFEDLGEPGDARIRADKLDEGLAVLDALWSGEPVDFQGEHYTVRDTRFTPRPLQRPRIPVWIGGGWPSRRPFRRAARWDGVYPVLKGMADTDTMPPGQLSEIVAYTCEHRPQHLPPLDVILEGNSAGDRAALADYEAAGLTWYVEKLGWWSGSVDDVAAVIRRGPPRR
jgi:hypothetical protein